MCASSSWNEFRRFCGSFAMVLRIIGAGATVDSAETLNSERVFDGKVFNVDRARVAMPTGGEVTVGVARPSPSGVLVPMPEPGRVTLVRQYRYAVNRALW